MSELYTGTAIIFKTENVLDSHHEGIRDDIHYMVGRYHSNLQGILKCIHKLQYQKGNQYLVWFYMDQNRLQNMRKLMEGRTEWLPHSAKLATMQCFSQFFACGNFFRLKHFSKHYPCC